MAKWKRDVKIGVLAVLGLLMWVLPWVWYGCRCCRVRSVSALAVEQPCVALTFDDGPRPATTERLLEGLAQRGVHATFFLVGTNLAGNEALAQQMARAGHQLGVHSQSHVCLAGLSRSGICAEIDPVRQSITALTGEEELMLRPPYGLTDGLVQAAAEMPIILWQVDPEDWSDRDTGRQVKCIVSEARDGDIILLHDIYDSSVDTALQAVDELMKKGFRFLTVEELFALRGVEPEAGVIYRRLPPC